MNVPVVSYQKILYPTDLSQKGRDAFVHAASLAHHYNAELTVFHAVDEGPELDRSLAGYINEVLWEEIKKRDLEEARQILLNRKRDNVAIRQCVGDYCEAIQKDGPDQPYVTYDIVVELGHPVEKILEHARAGNYDLIVMGNLGHTTLKDAVMGTTVQRVLRRAEIPVLVVRV